MNKDDNVSAVVKKALKYYEIPVTNDTIVESLHSHPHYPSLKSVCDIFSELQIDNYAMKMNKDELREMGAPFIAHLNDPEDKIAFVPKLNSNARLEYFDMLGKGKTIAEGEFFGKYSGVCILLDPHENAGEEDYAKKRQIEFLHRGLPYIAGLAIVFFTAYSILSYEGSLQITLIQISLLITKIIGLGIATLLLLKDLNISSGLADKPCGLNKKTDCNSLLNTDAARAFGWLHWSDLGFVYFITGLLMMITFPTANDYGLMALLSFGALGYVVYSIYYQSAVVKTWCPLCLGIQAVFIVEAIFFYITAWPLQLSWLALLKYSAIALIIGFGMTVYKAYFNNKKTSWQEKKAYLKFKKNPVMFTKLLLEKEQVKLNIPREVFVVGKSQAPVEVTAFLSLNCNPCQKAFNQLKTLFGKEDVKTNLIFSMRDKDKGFVNRIAQLFENEKQMQATKLLDTWYNTKGNRRTSFINQAEISAPNNLFETLQNQHMKLFKTAEIFRTPTILLNGYGFPDEYEIKDISYFIDSLKNV